MSIGYRNKKSPDAFTSGDFLGNYGLKSDLNSVTARFSVA